MTEAQDAKSWHVARRPLLAWLELAVKLVALLIGFDALVAADGAAERLALPAGTTLTQFIILALLAMGLTSAINDRVAEREIVSIVFIILNTLGHWGMVIALASVPPVRVLVVPFALLMLLGDLIKLLLLRVHRVLVREREWRGLVLWTSLYALGYALLLMVAWL